MCPSLDEIDLQKRIAGRQIIPLVQLLMFFLPVSFRAHMSMDTRQAVNRTVSQPFGKETTSSIIFFIHPPSAGTQ